MYNDKKYYSVKDIGYNILQQKVCQVEFLPLGMAFQLADNDYITLPNGAKIHSVRFVENTAPTDAHLVADIKEIAREFFKETKNVANK